MHQLVRKSLKERHVPGNWRRQRFWLDQTETATDTEEMCPAGIGAGQVVEIVSQRVAQLKQTETHGIDQH